MLKKSMLLAALAPTLALIPFSQAYADKDVGCGIGTQVWAGQSGVVPKVLAATTNGLFGNQTFGITFGTLGCSQGGVVHADARLSMFASANIDQLAADMAAGHGETLVALATIYGIDESQRPAFYHFAQQQYGAVFATPDTRSEQAVAALNAAMKADPAFARYVA